MEQIQNNQVITNYHRENAQFPGIALDGSLVYLCWQRFVDRHDSLMASCRQGDQVLWETEISDGGEVLHPVILSHNGTIWYAWAEYARESWRILARYFRDGQWSQVMTVAADEALFFPRLFVWQDQVHVIWTEQHKGSAAAVLCALSLEGAGEAQTVSVIPEAYRACAIEGGDGNLYVAYDGFDGKQYKLFARACANGVWGEEIVVSQSGDWASTPWIAAMPGGAVVGWYDYGYMAVYSVRSADLSVKDGVLSAGNHQVLKEGVDWYLDLHVASNSAGLQAMAYTRSKYDVLVCTRQGNGPWSRPVLMTYGDGHCAVHPKLLVTEDGTIHLMWQFGFKNGHLDRNASVIHNFLTPEEMAKQPDYVAPPSDFTQPIPANWDKKLDAHPADVVRTWLDKNGYQDLSLYFGDIHGQSGLSDGMGEVDQYYHRAQDKAKLDFTALTDHDCYPDWTTQSEWEMLRTNCRLMNKDGELACLLAYEWTPNEYKYDYGHKNVYYRGDEGEIFRSGDKGGMTPTDLYNSIRAYKALCIPHHPAADWGMVSAATDWNFHDPEVQRAVEIYSRHAPFEDFPSRSKFTKNIKKMEYCSVQDALARGYRLGFTAGSDSHQTEHGVEGGIVAAFVPSLKREYVWDALYNRLTYGTTGARILVSLKINGAPMGSEVKTLGDAPVTIEGSVLGTDTVTVELLRDNHVIKSWACDGNTCDFSLEDSAESGACYYLRVTQKDEHMAWSSPIWVDRA